MRRRPVRLRGRAPASRRRTGARAVRRPCLGLTGRTRRAEDRRDAVPRSTEAAKQEHEAEDRAGLVLRGADPDASERDAARAGLHDWELDVRDERLPADAQFESVANFGGARVREAELRPPDKSAMFVDPRSRPTPPWRGPKRRPAPSPGDVAPLRDALAAGRLYDAEAWVAAGNPLQFAYSADTRRSPTSPLQVAIWSRGYDAVLLLLCNGYRTELERRSPLTEALRARRLDLVRLLLEWGPTSRTSMSERS